MDHGHCAAADHPVSMFPGAETVVSILEVTEIFLVQRTDVCENLALNVNTRKNNALNVPVIAELINIFLSCAQLLTPERLKWHECSSMLKLAVGMSEPAPHYADIWSAVGHSLHFLDPVRLIDLGVII